MSTDLSFEAQQIAQALERQTMAMQALTDEIHAMTVTNQKILQVLIDVLLGDEVDEQVLKDMDGNPV